MIAILGFCVYINVLNGEFIWDDDIYIKYNAHIKSYSYIPTVFSEKMADGYIGIVPSGNFYRPLQKILYIICYAFWGLQPFGYHLVNVILHIAVALCLYWLVSILFSDKVFAWITALFYSVHPAHVEAVANMSGTQDPLSSVFLLLAFIFYLKTGRFFRIPFYAATLLCFFWALLSKENTIVLPFIFLLYHYVYKRKIKPVLFFSVTGVSLLYLFIRVTALGSFPVEASRSCLMVARIPGFFAGLTNYIRILFFPVGLHVHYGDMLFRFSDAKALLGVLFFVLIIWYAIKNREKDKLFIFAAGWFFIFLLPIANIYPINDSFIKEHWLYLPSIGFFLVLSRGLLIWCRDKRLKNFGLFVFIVMMLCYSLCTIKLNDYWSNPFTFFKRSIQYCPDYAIFYNELGIEYEKRALFKEALGFYQKALVKNPRYIDPYYNLGRAFIREGRYVEARSLFQQLLRSNPQDLSLYYSIAYCYDKINKGDEADKMRLQALQKSSEFAQKYRMEGDKFKDSGRLKDAVAAYRKALSFTPDDLSLYNDLGCAYFLNGDFRQAVEQFQVVLFADPHNAAIHNNLALVFYYNKQYDLAISSCDLAVKLGYPVDATFLSRLEPYRGQKKRDAGSL